MHAAKGGHGDVVQALVEAKADLHKQDEVRQTRCNILPTANRHTIIRSLSSHERSCLALR